MTNEEKLALQESNMNKGAEKLYEKYRPQMDALSKSPLVKARKRLLPVDVYSLGKQLEQFEAYRDFQEDAGNLNQLGKLPTIALDVITATMGVSILPLIALTQPLEEEEGIVWYKNVRSATTRGSQTAGDVVINPITGIVTPQGYASNKMENVDIGDTGGTPVTHYEFTLPASAIPIRSESLKIWVADAPLIYCQDIGGVGIGQLLGAGVSGTVNYLTGDVIIDFAVAPTASKDILGSWQQNYELSTDIPKIDFYLAHKSIKCHTYALKTEISMLQNFGLKKRFGMNLDDEAGKDLVQEINREIGGDLVRKVKAAAMGVTQFDIKQPQYISESDHRRAYKNRLADAEAILVGNAGRGTVNLIIAGTEQSAIISTLPGFEKIFDGNSLGAHVFGTLDGTVVIRVNETAILPSKEGIVLWKGKGIFEGPASYCPYMPLVMTDKLPVSPNPLGSQKAVAVMAGVEALVPEFISKLDIIDTTP